jgi:hypothetical protein
MKICENKLVKALLIVVVGGLSSYFIFKIGAETDELILVDYFYRILIVFGVVIVAMLLSSLITRKKK